MLRSVNRLLLNEYYDYDDDDDDDALQHR